MLNAILIGFCFMLIIEGLGPLLIPSKWRQFLYEVSQQPSEQLRRLGGILVVIGSISLYFLMN